MISPKCHTPFCALCRLHRGLPDMLVIEGEVVRMSRAYCRMCTHPQFTLSRARLLLRHKRIAFVSWQLDQGGAGWRHVEHAGGGRDAAHVQGTS